MSSNNVDRWSGIAAAAGGVLWLFPWSGWLVEVGNTAGFLIALLGLLLVMIGLIGLYRRIGDGQSAIGRTTFGVALLGVLAVMASALGGLLTGASLSGGATILAVLLFAGMLAVILGMAGMGVITLRQKALGRFSFAPLLLAAALIGYVISIGISVGDPSLEIVNDVFIALSYVSWLIFGYSLAASRQPMTDSAVTA